MIEDGKDGILSEREYAQERITIGRGSANDVVLKDPARVVSTKHAEIRASKNGWLVFDVGSTNGTSVNGQRILPKEEHVLHHGDRITVGPFQLVFECSGTDQATAAPSAPRDVVSQHNALGDDDPERILYLLRRAYAETASTSSTELDAALAEMLRSALGSGDAQKARATVRNVKSAVQSSLQRRDAASAAAETPSIQRSASSPPSVPETPPRRSAVIPDDVDKQVGLILRTVFGGLADAVRGRREFQKEFEVEATRILGGPRNPIKYAESADEIGAMLLHPESVGLTGEQVAAGLGDVFQDLTLHQLGLLAGFRECIRGLLKELDPEVIGKPQKGESPKKRIGLLSGGDVRADAAAWQRYVEKHRELTEEEVKVFERILAPQFAKGYLSVHKSRRRP